MAYVLATTESSLRWYVVQLRDPKDILNLGAGQFELIERLDLNVVPGFGNKDTAKMVAKALDLKSWRYVRVDSPERIFTLDKHEK